MHTRTLPQVSPTNMMLLSILWLSDRVNAPHSAATLYTYKIKSHKLFMPNTYAYEPIDQSQWIVCGLGINASALQHCRTQSLTLDMHII